jgi:hypothetical protein
VIPGFRLARLTLVAGLSALLAACGQPGRFLARPTQPAQQTLRFNDDTKLREGTLSSGAVTASIQHRQRSNGDGLQASQPEVTVTVDGATVGRMVGAEKLGGFSLASLLQIVELDRSNPYPEVLLSSFTGGAHCCNDTRVLTSDREGRQWQLVTLGPFDGGEMPATDPLANGTYGVEGVDNRFLYQFSSYAGSVAPPRFWQLQGTRFVDVSHQPETLPLHRRRLEQLSSWFREPVGDGEVNGFLAGYVATAALVGEFPAAWQQMLARYDRSSDWGLRSCTAGFDDQGRCRAPELVYPSFPSALAAFLVQTGYLSAPKRS